MNCKRWISIALLFMLLFSCMSGYCIAKWQGEKDHNRWMEEIIFGNPSYKYTKPQNIEQSVECLEDAILLCIDQFNTNYQDKLAKLNSLHIPGIPSDISSIDFSAGPNHRAFTHRGWYHTYAEFEIERGHANERKQLLYSVVNYIFGFSKHFSISEQADKNCDAMCCLLYITHILGD